LWPYLCNSIFIEGVYLLKKRYRLRKNKDFKRVYEGKRSFAAKTLVLYCYPQDVQAEPRIGFSVSKRVGSAVMRNFIKRRLREAIRPYVNELTKGMDYVIIARQSIVESDFSEIQKDLLKVLRKSGHLR